jgi:hypothetical protein
MVGVTQIAMFSVAIRYEHRKDGALKLTVWRHNCNELPTQHLVVSLLYNPRTEQACRDFPQIPFPGVRIKVQRLSSVFQVKLRLRQVCLVVCCMHAPPGATRVFQYRYILYKTSPNRPLFVISTLNDGNIVNDTDCSCRIVLCALKPQLQQCGNRVTVCQQQPVVTRFAATVVRCCMPPQQSEPNHIMSKGHSHNLQHCYTKAMPAAPAAAEFAGAFQCCCSRSGSAVQAQAQSLCAVGLVEHHTLELGLEPAAATQAAQPLLRTSSTPLLSWRNSRLVSVMALDTARHVGNICRFITHLLQSA